MQVGVVIVWHEAGKPDEVELLGGTDGTDAVICTGNATAGKLTGNQTTPFANEI